MEGDNTDINNFLGHKNIYNGKTLTLKEGKKPERLIMENGSPTKDVIDSKTKAKTKLNNILKTEKKIEVAKKPILKKKISPVKVETEPKKKVKPDKEIKDVENFNKVSPKKDVTDAKPTTDTAIKKTEKKMKSVEHMDETDVKSKDEKAAEMLQQLLANNKTEKSKKLSRQKLDIDVKKLKAQTRAQSASKNDFAIVSLIEMRKKEALSNKENKIRGTAKKAYTSDKFRGTLHGEQMNPDIDLMVESSVVLEDIKIEEVPHIVIGEKILKYKTPLSRNVKRNEKYVFENFERTTQNDTKTAYTETSKSMPKPRINQKQGILRFALSDEKFIAKGWTMLPAQKVVRKMYVYRMWPCHPEFDWFKNNEKKGQILYDSGERLAEFGDDSCGRLFYRTGNLALDYYNAEESNIQQRYVVYSTGEPDERGHPRPTTILATFDHIGNGVVFDHTGKIRLKYNQTEGVVLDRSIGPMSHWKWHTLNDPPELQQVMIDTHAPHKDPRLLEIKPDQGDVNTVVKDRPGNEAMLAIEFSNFIKDKSRKLSQTFKPFQIRMKAFKINENFSLRILDQATVYLIFRDGNNNVKLNIGMILDHTEIVDTVAAEVGDCSISFEKLPASTESVAALQKALTRTQQQERVRARRELRLRPAAAAPAVSADRLRLSTSRPLRSPFLTHSCTSRECKCTFKISTLPSIY